MIKRHARFAACAVSLICGPSAFAQDAAVDVELVLAVDVSGSMNGEELRLQRDGYVAALRSPEVWRAVESGRHGAVAITYVEWARDDLKRVIIPWTRIAGEADALAVADILMAAPVANMRNTSITGALRFAAAAFDGNGFDAERRVIDVSGDGPNNQGGAVTEARDAVLDAGITINGLPLEIEEWTIGGLFGRDATLADYYEACVTGGPMSFVMPVRSWQEFPMAVRQKLVLELSGRVPDAPARLWRAAATPPDCLIGERMRRQWQDP
jgi:Protein of unknown function (DUF1194)